MKRIKAKMVNGLFRDRLKLLDQFSKEDVVETQQTLRVYNALSTFIFDHQSVLERMLKIAERWHRFEHSMETAFDKFIQSAVNEELRGSQRPKL